MDHGRRELGLATIVAIVSPDNERSCRLLVKLGFRLERRVRLKPDDDELELYAAAA
jgi:RimJ/RimL family protein N-acetyltransferase